MCMVSVIIPNYNHSLFLKQRIDSVLNQTYNDIEVIILDDNSTDDSKIIIEQYRDNPKVSHIVYNEVNSGSTFRQWQKGIALAKGEYIWIAESDDYADATLLELVVSVFEQNLSVGLVQVQSYDFDENGKIRGLWKNRNSYRDWNSDFKESGIQFIKGCMLESNPIVNASAVVFRKSILSDGMVDPTFTLNGDWAFYIKILLKSDFYNIGKPLNYFRQHNNKGSSGNVRNYNNILEYARIINLVFRNINLSKKDKDTARYVFVSMWAEQADNNLLLILKNKFLLISKEAFKNDKLFFPRLIKRVRQKNHK